MKPLCSLALVACLFAAVGSVIFRHPNGVLTYGFAAFVLFEYLFFSSLPTKKS